MQEVFVVTTIAAIDTETQMVTLMSASGETKTVKARDPENLKKVKVGHKYPLVNPRLDLKKFFLRNLTYTKNYPGHSFRSSRQYRCLRNLFISFRPIFPSLP